MLIGVHNVLVGVADSKVGKDVSTTNSDVEQVHANGTGNTVLAESISPEHIAQGHKAKVHVLLGTNAVTRVEVELPTKRHKDSDDGVEDDCLQLEPGLVALDSDQLVESNERKGVKVHIVLELLWGSMVFVVLITPPSTRHTTPCAVHKGLDESVDGDVSSHAVMSPLVH